MVDAGAKTVLVVEDDPVQSEVLSLVLREGGHAVVTAEDAEGGLHYLRTGAAPDLILLDMLLPRRDGWWFLRQRQRDPALARIPFVIVTALPIASDEWATSLGAAGLLRKPIDLGALTDLVGRC